MKRENYRLWKSKQNLDYSYLMMYSAGRGEYYLQLEDDVVAEKNYIDKINNFIEKCSNSEWFMLQFSSLGFIGKLFRKSSLHTMVNFFLIYFRDLPCDYFLLYAMKTRVCPFDRPGSECPLNIKKLAPSLVPSLFLHEGLQSSLYGKIHKPGDKKD